jgi:hydroxyethylthiazole kinase-like uncharacterized protein yjeF
MARAGAAAARYALAHLTGARPGKLLALAGPGNNGGDAIVAACALRHQGVPVDVYLLGRRDHLPPEAAAAAHRWQSMGGSFLETLPVRPPALVLDGLFGIGLDRPIEGDAARLIDAVHHWGCPILALDIPSGIQGDTGARLGCAVRASATLTFIGLKPGLLTLDGPDHTGTIEVAPIGIDPSTRGAPDGFLIDGEALTALHLPRPRNFHKGNAGTVGVIGGAAGMTGAALLAGRAALRAGAGKVLVGMLSHDHPAVDPLTPELMQIAPALAIEQASALAIGPGLGSSLRARALLAAAITRPVPLVIDADALNLIARLPALESALRARTQATLLTPHPAEAGRLLGRDTQGVQANRLGAARQIAARFNATVVLKGNGSIVADPTGPFAIIGSGNPGMAAAGMGDCLTGILAALLARGLDRVTAAQAGAWLHGAAGDRAARRQRAIGLSATEVADEARQLINPD